MDCSWRRGASDGMSRAGTHQQIRTRGAPEGGLSRTHRLRRTAQTPRPDVGAPSGVRLRAVAIPYKRKANLGRAANPAILLLYPQFWGVPTTQAGASLLRAPRHMMEA